MIEMGFDPGLAILLVLTDRFAATAQCPLSVPINQGRHSANIKYWRIGHVAVS